MSSHFAAEKGEIEHAESLKQHDDLDQYHNAAGIVREELLVDLPASLVGLSDEEIAKLDKQVTLRLDLVVIPCLMILYILNYLDRQNIASAKLDTLVKDLKLTPVQYSTCISCLFAGYIAFQVPSNMILGKIKWPAMYLCLMTALWGAVSAATGAVNSFGSLLACRFLLGCVEAAFFPGAYFYLSCWYTKKQIAFRTALLYAGSQLGNAFGALLAIGILKLGGTHGLAGWRWLFIVEGIATIGIAAIFAFIMPNRPKTFYLLSDIQKDRLQYRLEFDRGTKDASDEMSALTALREVVVDPKVWLLCGTLYCCYVAAAINNFFPTVVSSLGYSRTLTYVLTAPPFLLCCVVILCNGLHSDKKRERFLHVLLPFIPLMISNILAVSSLKTAPRYIAMMLAPGSAYSAAIVILSWIATTITGPALKRAVAISFINAICNTPNIWTSYLYTHAPRFLEAFATNLAASILAMLFAFATYTYLKRQNARLDRGESCGKSGPTPEQIASGFRYSL